MNWFNTAWLFLDIAIIVILIPVVILQRESGATLAWIHAIVFLPFIALLGFCFFGEKQLHLHMVLNANAFLRVTLFRKEPVNPYA